MKKAFLVAVVVLLVLIGLPILMPGMAAAHCDDCGPALAGGGACLVVVLVALLALTALRAESVRTQRRVTPGLLRSAAFDPPPQLA